MLVFNRTESQNFALQHQQHEVNSNIIQVNTLIMSKGTSLNNQLIIVVEMDRVKFSSSC